MNEFFFWPAAIEFLQWVNLQGASIGAIRGKRNLPQMPLIRLYTNRLAERAWGLNGVCWVKWAFRDVIVAVWDLRQGLKWKARSRLYHNSLLN